MAVVEVADELIAIVDGVCLMVVADGILERQEVDFLNEVVAAFLELERDTARALVTSSMARLEDADPTDFLDEIVRRVENTNRRQQLMIALQLAAMADGVRVEEEASLLDTFSARLALTHDEIISSIHAAQLLLSHMEQIEAHGGN